MVRIAPDGEGSLRSRIEENLRRARELGKTVEKLAGTPRPREAIPAVPFRRGPPTFRAPAPGFKRDDREGPSGEVEQRALAALARLFQE